MRISCPGSLIIFGEHAVLRGGHAVVMAVSQRLTVTLTEKIGPRVRIVSNLGSIDIPNDVTEVLPPFHYALRILNYYGIRENIHIEIKSDFSDQIGFGSSAALVGALAAGLTLLKGGQVDYHKLFHEGLAIIRDFQGIGSGADLAASLFGGVILFRTDPLLVEHLLDLPPLTAIYTGHKTPTPMVARAVAARFARMPLVLKSLDQAIEQVTLHAVKNLHDPREVGASMNLASGLLNVLGVQDEVMDHLIQRLRAQPGILGVKPSGAGLGDCLICLGDLLPDPVFSQVMPLTVSPEGLQIEKVG